MIKTTTKIYLLRVKLDDFRGVYAEIEAKDTTTYEQLHDVIFKAFERYDEHLYLFTLKDGRLVTSPNDWQDGDVLTADKCKLGKSLKIKDKIKYLFDFGDEWNHTIEVRDIQEKEIETYYPRIVKIHGEIPPQYPEDDDWDEEEYEDFDVDDTDDNNK